MVTSVIDYFAAHRLAVVAVDALGPVTPLHLSGQLGIRPEQAERLLQLPEFGRYPRPWGPPLYTLSDKLRGMAS